MTRKNGEASYQVYQLLGRHAAKKQTFTTAGLIKELGFDKTPAKAGNVHAMRLALTRDGIIEVLPTGRKRHQLFQVNQDRIDDLDRRTERARRRTARYGGNSASQHTIPTSAPRREIYVEQHAEVLEKAANDDTAGIQQLLREVAELRGEVHQLVEIWS